MQFALPCLLLSSWPPEHSPARCYEGEPCVLPEAPHQNLFPSLLPCLQSRYSSRKQPSAPERHSLSDICTPPSEQRLSAHSVTPHIPRAIDSPQSRGTLCKILTSRNLLSPSKLVETVQEQAPVIITYLRFTPELLVYCSIQHLHLRETQSRTSAIKVVDVPVLGPIRFDTPLAR